MLWAFRILSGLWIVTFGYILTIGQAGLEPVNRNICELFNTVSPWPWQSCAFQNVIVALWALGAVASAIFLSVELIRWVRKKLKPANAANSTATRVAETPKPILKCSFNMSDAGCVRRDTIYTETFFVRVAGSADPPQQFARQTKCDWYRLRVDAEGGNIPGCRGRILSVTRAGNELLAGENPLLPFAHGNPNDGTITIHEGVQEHMDLLVIFEDGRAELNVPLDRRSSSINWQEMFRYAGEYKLKLAVTAPDATATSIDLLFRWNLNPATAEIVTLPESRIIAEDKPASDLQIEVGESGPFFKTSGGPWYTKRTFNVKLSNNHDSKSAEFCRLHIITIEPQKEYEGPWTFPEIRSLPAGDHVFIPLAEYGEVRRPEQGKGGDSFFSVLVGKSQPLLPIEQQHEFLLRATAHDMPPSEFRCKLWVDDKGRFRIEKV